MIPHLRGSLFTLLLFLAIGCTPTPKYQGIDMSTHNRIPLAPVCVGQFTLQFPRNGESRWSVRLDWSRVERLPLRLRDARDFWAHVEGRRDALAAQHHNVEPSLLSHYERLDDHAALLMHRRIPVNQRVYYLERYLWLGDRGYLFKGLGEGEEIKAKLPAYKRIFARLQPLTRIDQKGGFCIDGAVVDLTSLISAQRSIEPQGMGYTFFDVNTGEASSVQEISDTSVEDPSGFSAFRKMEIDREQFKLFRSDDYIRDDPASPKAFDVLRKEHRTVAGRLGEEAIWRKTLNNGVRKYRFLWLNSDGQPSLHDNPSLLLQMDSGDEMDPDATPVPEEDLLALWDTVLDSAKRR